MKTPSFTLLLNRFTKPVYQLSVEVKLIEENYDDGCRTVVWSI